MKTVVHIDSMDVQVRLAQLGLRLEYLHEAILVGEAARNSCTDNDPPMLRGFLAWGRRMRGLRDILGPLGWRRDDADNYATVVDAANAVAIATCSGDDGTGLQHAIPKTKHPRGAATEAVIEENQQLEFDGFRQTMAAIQANPAPCATWILLVARTSTHLYCELSLPASQGTDDRIDQWIERILLPSLPLPGVAVPVFVDLAASQPDIDVVVTRKAG